METKELLEKLEVSGFFGFKKMSNLFEDSSMIPKEKGIYLVLNLDKKSDFLEVGTGGCFKGKNPNVSLETLENNWVNDAVVVYIGKATELQSRLKLYFHFGQGKNVGHYGGRLIWQLKNSNDLIVCWKTLPEDDPRKVEANLIQKFTSKYDKRPFANLED